MAIRELEKLFHPQIQQKCGRLFLDAHFQEAIGTAFRLVELAIKEKSGSRGHGVRLIQKVFGSKNGPPLNIPFGDECQKAAQAYLVGAFSFYRNEAVHGALGFNEKACARCLIIASDLLDLIGVANLHFQTEAELLTLASSTEFSTVLKIKSYLNALEGQLAPEGVFDGILEDLPGGDSEFQFVFEAGLIEYSEVPNEFEDPEDQFCVSTMGVFNLTQLGRRVIDDTLGA